MAKYPYRDIDNGFGRDTRNNLNANFDDVEADLKDHDTRIDNIIAQSGTSDTEVVDARYDSNSGVTHAVLKDRLDTHSNEIGNLLGSKTNRINVKQPPYNCIGDGVADDTTAIKNAIAALGDSHILYLPKGNYRITDTLVIDGLKKHVIGDGLENTYITLDVTGTTKDALQFTNQSYGTIGDFTVISKTKGTGRHGIYIPYRVSNGVILDITLERLWVQNFGVDGIKVENPVHVTLNKVRTTSNAGIGFNLEFVSGVGAGQAGTNISAIDCWFQGNNSGSTSVRLNSHLAGNFFNCQFEIADIGVSAISCSLLNFYGCHWEDINNDSLYLDRCHNVNVYNMNIDTGTSAPTSATYRPIINVYGTKRLLIDGLRYVVGAEGEKANYTHLILERTTTGSVTAEQNVYKSIQTDSAKPISISESSILHKDNILTYGDTRIKNMRLQPSVRTTVPTSPSVGEIAISDGSWGPNASRGLLIYKGSGVWDTIKLF